MLPCKPALNVVNMNLSNYNLIAIDDIIIPDERWSTFQRIIVYYIYLMTKISSVTFSHRLAIVLRTLFTDEMCSIWFQSLICIMTLPLLYCLTKNVSWLTIVKRVPKISTPGNSSLCAGGSQRVKWRPFSSSDLLSFLTNKSIPVYYI